MSVAPRNQEPKADGQARRRQFSVDDKLRILADADACTEPGAIGALLRREGLHASQLSTWREQRAAGARAALGQRRGRKPRSAESREFEQLQREHARLEAELAEAREVIAIQKAVAARLRDVADGRDLEPSRRR